MSAQDYPITFAYGATSAPYTTASPHRGDDRACPSGTPVIIGGVTIGLTGATGWATGPHLHIQEWQGDVKNTRKPQNSFKGGTVTGVGTGTQWGKFVTITLDGWNTTYCHLSSQNVSNGTVIKGGASVALTRQNIIDEYLVNRGKAPSEGEISAHLNGGSWASLSLGFRKENDAYRTNVASTEASLRSQVGDLTEKLALSEKSRGVLTEANQKLIRQLKDLETNHDQEIKDLKEDYERDLDEAATECAAKIEAAKNQTPPKGTLFETPQTWKQWLYVTINFIRGLRR